MQYQIRNSPQYHESKQEPLTNQNKLMKINEIHPL